MKDSKEKRRRILQKIPLTFEERVGASEISKATGYSSMSIAMYIRNHLDGVKVESKRMGPRKIYRRIT